MENTKRPFRLSGIKKDLNYPEKWVDKVLTYRWIYIYRYTDKEDGFFETNEEIL